MKSSPLITVNENLQPPVYFHLSLLGTKQYDYIDPKYQDKAELCYVDTDSFIIHIKIEDFYNGIANDVEKCFAYLTMMKMIKGCFQ